MVIVGILLILTCIGIFLYTWHRLYESLHFHVNPDEKHLKKYASLPRETLALVSSDGVKISGWYVKAAKPKAFVILVHGYETETGGKTDMLGYAKFLREAGYSSLLIDLRSFGKSEGNQIYLGVREWRDVVTAYDFLKNQPETKGKKIGLLGVSMGAATSLIAAGESGKGDFVIASVPYASYRDLFLFRTKKEGLSPILFTPPLQLAAFFVLGFNYPQFDPHKEIVKLHVPVLIFQATQDKSVPSNDAKILYEAAHEPKVFWVSRGGHDIFAEKPKLFEAQVLAFLQQVVTSKTVKL